MRALAAAAALLAAGCTPTRSDVVSWNRVRLDALRERLQRVTGSLPPPGEAVRFAGHPPVEPLPHLGPALDHITNADLMPAENLEELHSRGAVTLKSWHLLGVMRLLEPQGGDATALAERDSSFREEVKHVLALRYLVVVRAGVSTQLEAFVVDLATGSIRASVTLPDRATAVKDLPVRLGEATGGTFALGPEGSSP